MKTVRLQSGFFDINGDAQEAADGSWLIKPALLVYTGKFGSMDGEVEITEAHLSAIHDRFNRLGAGIRRLAENAGLVPELPLVDCPPVQLDHTVTAVNTVGRFIGPMALGEIVFTDDEGKDTTSQALFGRVKILGRENVEKVKDGRWIHLSIGADLEGGKLNELTITPFPAAPHAAMLSRYRLAQSKKEVINYKGWVIEVYTDEGGNCTAIVEMQTWKGTRERVVAEAKKWVDSNGTKMSAETATTEKQTQELSNKGDDMPGYKELKEKMAAYDKCRKHLQAKCSEDSDEQREERLAAMSDDEVTSMSAEYDEEQKKLSAENPPSDEENVKKEAKMARLAAEQTNLARLREGRSTIRLARNKSRIGIRLSSLLSQGKITPAEVKKIDVVRLAAEGDEVITATLKSYDDRQPVIDARVYGSMQAESIESVAGKALRFAQKEAEVKARMGARRGKGTKMSSDTESEEKLAETIRNQVAEQKTQISGSHLGELQIIHKLMTEGKHAEATAQLGALLPKFQAGEDADIPKVHEDAEKHLSALADYEKFVDDQITASETLIADLQK